MYSTTQMNVQHQQVGLTSSRPSQTAVLHTYNSTWNQQTAEANSSCQYAAANMGTPPPQTKSFTFQDGAYYNRDMSNWQTTVPSYQTSRENTSVNNRQKSTNMPSRNATLQVINATNHNFYPNSAQTPKPNMMFTSPAQNRVVQWNQSASGQRKVQPRRTVRSMCAERYPAHVTTATSLQRQHTVYTNTLASSAAHVTKSVHKQNPRHVTRQRSCSSTSPQSYSAAVSHLKNKNATQYSTSSAETWHNSRTTQQYLLLHNSQIGHPQNPAIAAAAQHQRQRLTADQEISRIADSLHGSYISGPGHTATPRRGECLAENRLKECNQTVLPVTSADANGCNPNITQSIKSRVHHIVHVPLHQSSATIAYIPVRGAGSDQAQRADSAPLPQNDSSPNGSPTYPRLLRLMLMDNNISCQGSEVQSSAANSGEKLEMLSSATRKDIHTSPGSTGPRAVAVVQPLAQESNQGTGKSSDATSQLDECTAKDTCLSNPQKSSPPSVVVAKTGHSASSNDCTVGDVLAMLAMQEESCVSSASQKSVTSKVPESQSGNTDKTDPKTHVSDLASVPASPWTYKSLMNLIQEGEISQVASEENDLLNKIFSIYWDGKIKHLSDKLKSGWYRDLINSLKKYCSEYSKEDTVIMSQVAQSPEKLSEHYHVLKDDETYSELPYRSSWLNANEQLDDIDKEFGYPVSWMYYPNMRKSLSQPDQVGTVNGAPVQIASDVPNKVLPQTEVESADSAEEKRASPAEAISPQTSSPCKNESDDSSDPYYSFEIQVLSPEQAKMIFLQSETLQSTDVDSRPKEVMKSSAEDELPNVRGAASSDLSVICCIDKWLEKFNVSAKSKCKCSGEQHDKDSAEVKASTAPKKYISSVIRSDSESTSPIIGCVHQEDIDVPVRTCDEADLCNDVRPIIDLTEDSENLDSQNISHISIDDSRSSIILLSESEGENQPSSETPTQISDSEDQTLNPDEERSQDHLESAESAQSSGSDNGIKEVQLDLSSEAVSHTVLQEEDSAQAQLRSTDLSVEVEEQTEVSVTDAPEQQSESSFTQKHEHVQLKRKTPNTTDQSFPFPKTENKSRPSDDVGTQTVLKDAKPRKDFVDAAPGEPPASKRIVELALFGSEIQSRCISTDNLKCGITSPVSWTNTEKRAPGVVTVTLSPLKRKPSAPPLQPSVKQSIYEKWWRSYSLTKITHGIKLTTKKSATASSSAGSPNETDAPATNKEELPGASERRTCNGSAKRCRGRKRKRSVSSGLKHEEEKKMKQDFTLSKGRSDAEKGSCAVKPVLKDGALRFNVLPSTFTFVDGSKERRETTAHLSGKAYYRYYWTLLVIIKIDRVTR